MKKSENISIDVIATSDMHSYFLNGPDGSNIYRAGTYVNRVRENNPNVILLDSGGSLAGSLAAYYYAIVAPYKRHPMIKLMNAMHYDASGISPNEFKFGLPFFSRSIALSRFPWLSANIEYQRTKEPYFSTPYTIKTISGVKIAIVGLTSDGLMKREHFEMESDVSMAKTMLTAKRWIRYIHESESPDFLIVIYHGGLNQLSQKPREHEQEVNEAEKIIQNLGVIDLLITGHQHQTYIGRDNETLYVQAGQNAEQLVHVNVNFKKHTTSYEVDFVNSEIVDLNQYPEDSTLLTTTYYDRKAVEHWMDEIISEQVGDLTVDGLEDVVTRPHPFIQLLHDSIQREHAFDISCVHLPCNGERGLSGQVTNQDIFEAYPHPDVPIDITVKGADIKQILEYSYGHLEFSDGELSLTIIDETLCTFCQGVEYDVDMTQPPNHRVTLHNINLDHMYRVVMTDYCYRNYQQILDTAIIHHTDKNTMGERIAQQLQDDEYQLEHKQTFKVKLK
ncbi:bifunctional metallophosphatase/5'-nucleotidase [Staphylococcus pettenkoferi]|uniref:bifunctional metallophosphatase/5'-nucleotidase n=1 Tax=Staphylococcus pettenkoferi TaxID=170573 RepID=UPI001F570DD0|nr:bifunctional UDP-sugar hydrolase/5'-nucleotidase [Staphylococcus pettenkoferi]MCI2803000.1 bifunctional metallophosphatase/5'-nucleotidase [Staphylococcus pettenkoferi]MCY1573799.1 bifunctional metallophosphatase/5'-nucleotidase [Staphylococcus pettenkoferi]MCY1578028.1 bifunctional metallophosphatase/5'-nucleotidase [Staphylococcus pettenkoferi]MCY1584755.1 bifunctional metallophosphatase/5'-nucleotidase [Staphylococcus pettenkoferi]MCY1615584.1 bifunctional metallophosphatase/5'-nucleotid